MHYKELFIAAKLFKTDEWAYDVAYTDAKNVINWQNLHLYSTDIIKEVVLGFLNNWKCRLPTEFFEEIACLIKDSYEQTKPFFDVLADESLEAINFNDVKNVEGQQIRISDIIYRIFTTFCDIGYKFRWVAASKTIHMINSSLFVMWDNPICKSYGFDISKSAYAYNFMPLMKQHAEEAINSYINYKKCDRDTAIKEIMHIGYDKTLAKLVDEYNYIKYTRQLHLSDYKAESSKKIYICKKCGRKHTQTQYYESMFCRSCGTFLHQN